MRLNTYMTREGIKDADLAETVGCDRTTILRVRRDEQRPSHALMEKIAEATSGAVRPDDFFTNLPEQDAA